MRCQSAIGRGDLLRCLNGLGSERDRDVAEFCGYESEVPTPEPKRAANRIPEPNEVPPQPPPDVPRLPFAPASTVAEYLTALTATFKDVQDGGDPLPEILKDDELHAPKDWEPKRTPLTRWARVWPFLRHILGEDRPSGRANVRELVADISRGRIIRRVPRVCRLTWAREAVVVRDHGDELRPFWDDMAGLIRSLKRVRGRQGLQVVTLPDSWPQLAIASRAGARPAPILALGDLGCLRTGKSLVEAWKIAGVTLRRRGHRLSALLPCPRGRWDAAVTGVWASSAWDRGERLRPAGVHSTEARNVEKEAAVVNRLMSLLAPVARCESALLRDVRLLLGTKAADVGTEYDVWNHPESNRSLSAFALHSSAAIQRRECLQTNPDALLGEMSRLLDRHHAGYSVTVRCKETINLHHCGAPVPQDRLEEALAVQSKIGQTTVDIVRQADPGQIHQSGLVEYFREDVATTSTQEMKAQPALSVGYGVMLHVDKETVAELPQGIDPEIVQRTRRELVEEPSADSLWAVSWRADRLILFRWPVQGGAPGLVTGVPVAWVRARHRGFSVRTVNSAGRRVSRDVQMAGAYAIRIQTGPIRELEIESDRVCVGLELIKKPEWAVRHGQDQFGQFADLEVKGVRIAFRWIPPGIFLMGSPAAEVGRFENEGPQHLVTVSQGFWMGVTPVTQSQWELVMGSNPSQDEPMSGDPVNGVSAEMADSFCKRLGTIAHGLPFRLPSEAEWEYACRSGTESAFNDGSELKPVEARSQIEAALSFVESQSNQKAGKGLKVSGDPQGVRGGNWWRVPSVQDMLVGDLVHSGQENCNAWGLLGFHGNVWQWCSDLDLRRYDASVGDPKSIPGRARVMRGGSALTDWRVWRSAARMVAPPGFGGHECGLRVVLGDLLDAFELPKWARNGGRDSFGHFAEFEANGVPFRLRWIPPGNFVMGSPDSEKGRFEDEGPQHRVTLTRGLWLAATPVTQAQWEVVMGGNPSAKKGPHLPVESVSWEDCRNFNERLAALVPGFPARFPMEAEWEYACRAGTTSAFNDGSDCTEPTGVDPALDRLGWYDENSGHQTHPVGLKPANKWGLFDMHGNVWEWCEDHGQRNYESNVVDPVSTADNAWRVVRGGSAWYNAWFCRSACRCASGPGNRCCNLGFRLAAGPESGPKAERREAGGAVAPVPEAPDGRRGAKVGDPEGRRAVRPSGRSV